MSIFLRWGNNFKPKDYPIQIQFSELMYLVGVTYRSKGEGPYRSRDNIREGIQLKKIISSN